MITYRSPRWYRAVQITEKERKTIPGLMVKRNNNASGIYHDSFISFASLG